jgi:quercetin dioxygenase-like cupin family protein
MQRLYSSAHHLQPSTSEPIRSVITESTHATIVAWHLKPGQAIAPHIHPGGQDTWTILSGKGQYYLDKIGTKQAIAPGDIVIAPEACVHGVYNHGEEDLIFISVVSPAEAGYQLVVLED